MINHARSMRYFLLCTCTASLLFAQIPQAEQIDAKQINSEQVDSEQIDSEQIDSEQIDSEQTETDSLIDLIENPPTYEIPDDIADGLSYDTPVGTAAAMSPQERASYVSDLFTKDRTDAFWENHTDVSAVFRRFNEDTAAWAEYSCTFETPDLWYSDDWMPDYEELRYMVIGENDCVEEFTQSIHFVRFLNASGSPFCDRSAGPLTFSKVGADETLLKTAHDALADYYVTQIPEDEIYQLGLEDPEEDAFYTCTYAADRRNGEIRTIRISLHRADRSVTDVRDITYSYDAGMTPFVQAGYDGLLRHLNPQDYWPDDLRTVSVIVDPGLPEAETFTAQALKGDIVSITLPESYVLYSDASCTSEWIDDGDRQSDLTLYAAPETDSEPETEPDPDSSLSSDADPETDTNWKQ